MFCFLSNICVFFFQLFSLTLQQKQLIRPHKYLTMNRKWVCLLSRQTHLVLWMPLWFQDAVRQTCWWYSPWIWINCAYWSKFKISNELNHCWVATVSLPCLMSSRFRFNSAAAVGELALLWQASSQTFGDDKARCHGMALWGAFLSTAADFHGSKGFWMYLRRRMGFGSFLLKSYLKREE